MMNNFMKSMKMTKMLLMMISKDFWLPAIVIRIVKETNVLKKLKKRIVITVAMEMKTTRMIFTMIFRTFGPDRSRSRMQSEERFILFSFI